MTRHRELTLRALLTGLALGALLTPSNVYSGLKIGWSFNMSIIALLLGFAFWNGPGRRRGQQAWSMHESNINQTTASAAASIISGGLVAPIPAYTMLTGHSPDTLALVAWVFSVSFLGVWVAWYLRPSFIVGSELRFPEGMATLATLQEIYGQGAEAGKRVAALGAAASLSSLVKLADLAGPLPRWAPSPMLERLTFTAEPSLLLLGFGGIVGLRVGLSLVAGALLAWGMIAPWLLRAGWVEVPAGATGQQFATLVEWLLWPGVGLMVCATLASLGLRAVRERRVAAGGAPGPAPAASPEGGPPASGLRHAGLLRRGLPGLPATAMLIAATLVIALQVALFDIDPLLAAMSVPLAVLLAIVAARVVGTTGIPPIGAIGKLSQLAFGAMAPGQVAINLMSANSAGGAAGQATDLLNDFKVGNAIGASPSRQAIGQCLGIVVGSLVGVLVYRLLIPDPQAMLITAEWPAPAVATWKAVAEALTGGIDSIAVDSRWAMLVGAVAGIALGTFEALLPVRRLRWWPSSAALGLAFIVPASVSLVMGAGAILVWLLGRCSRGFADRFAIVVAAGLVAGESITGVGASLVALLRP